MSAGQRLSSRSFHAAASSSALNFGAAGWFAGRGDRLNLTCVFSAMKGTWVNWRIACTGWFCIVCVTSSLTRRKKSEKEISSATEPSSLTSEPV